MCARDIHHSKSCQSYTCLGNVIHSEYVAAIQIQQSETEHSELKRIRKLLRNTVLGKRSFTCAQYPTMIYLLQEFFPSSVSCYVEEVPVISLGRPAETEGLEAWPRRTGSGHPVHLHQAILQCHVPQGQRLEQQTTGTNLKKEDNYITATETQVNRLITMAHQVHFKCGGGFLPLKEHYQLTCLLVHTGISLASLVSADPVPTSFSPLRSLL